MSKELKKVSELSDDQLRDLVNWLISDNVVIETDANGKNTYRAQCNQYVTRFTDKEIVNYWWNEYGKHQDYDDVES